MKRQLMSFVITLALLLTGADVWAVPFNSLYAFGDSLSDGGSSPSAVLSISKLLGGSCDPFHPCPPYYDGRYSNGPVAVEYLAGAILPGGATSSNFYNFAVSGATSGVGNYGDGGTAASPGAFGLPGISQEVGLYLASSGGVADPDALYFVWGGANDFLTLDSPFAAAQNIAGYVGALAAAGAEHILVPNLPDLGFTPYVRSVGLESVAHAFTVGFNAELATQLGNLGSVLPATNIIQFDAFSLLNTITANPSDYGFSDAQHACLGSSPVAPCANPASYVYWDDFHPTTQTHAVFASAFANAVPEPGTVVLLSTGMIGLFAWQRKRAMETATNV